MDFKKTNAPTNTVTRDLVNFVFNHRQSGGDV